MKMKLTKLGKLSLIVAALIVIVICGLVFFTDDSIHNRTAETVRIGYAEHSSFLPFYVAFDKGYYREEGLNVEAVEIGAISELLTGLLAGKFDYIDAYTFTQFFAVEAESPGKLKFFASGGETMAGDVITAILVRNNSDIKSLSDLKGKTVGLQQADATHLKLILKLIGLNPDSDVNIIALSKDALLPSLQSGNVDAVWTQQPFVTIATETLGAQILLKNPRAKYVSDPFWTGPAAIVTSEYYERNPETVRKLLRAYDRAIDFIRSNTDEAKIIETKYTSLPPDIATKSGFYFIAKPSEQVDLVKVQELADFYYLQGILSRKIDVRNMYGKMNLR